MTAPRNVNLAGPSPSALWGSPPALVECARVLLGDSIELDLASSAERNASIGAARWFGPGSEHPDALRPGVPWQARTAFLNPPGGGTATRMPPARDWWVRLRRAWEADAVGAAVFVAFSADAVQWSQADGEGGILALPCWVPERRLRYLDPTTGRLAPQAPKPSIIVWLPSRGELGLGLGALRERLAHVMRPAFPGVAVGSEAVL